MNVIIDDIIAAVIIIIGVVNGEEGMGRWPSAFS